MALWSVSDPGASEKADFAAGNAVSTPEAAFMRRGKATLDSGAWALL